MNVFHDCDPLPQKGQHLHAALTARLHDDARPYSDGALFLKETFIRLFETGSLKSSTGAVAEVLFELAREGLHARQNQSAAALDKHTVLDEKACHLLFRAIERIALVRTKNAQRLLALSREDQTVRQEALESVLPPGIPANVASLPFDCVHDGQLICREKARAAGLLRWAKTLDREMSTRIEEAFLHAELSSVRAGLAWRERRPFVVIDSLNPYSMKLVHDVWLYEPSIAVINVGVPFDVNPFRAFRIPLIHDTHHFLSALFALPVAPAIIEPRLGGFSVSVASGLVDLRGKVPVLPAFLRTLAEIGLLGRERLLRRELSESAALKTQTRIRVLTNFKRLTNAPISHESATLSDSQKALIRETRQRVLTLRERLCVELERLEQATKKDEKRLHIARSLKNAPSASLKGHIVP